MTADRTKHLEFIQATISRQASHSFAIKGWSLTVAGIIYAYTAANLSCWLAAIALLPPAAFAWLDLYYLRQERLFRELYRECIRPDTSVSLFDMTPSAYHNAEKYPQCSYARVMRSNSWWVLHGMIMLVGVVLLVVSIFQ